MQKLCIFYAIVVKITFARFKFFALPARNASVEDNDQDIFYWTNSLSSVRPCPKTPIQEKELLWDGHNIAHIYICITQSSWTLTEKGTIR